MIFEEIIVNNCLLFMFYPNNNIETKQTKMKLNQSTITTTHMTTYSNKTKTKPKNIPKHTKCIDKPTNKKKKNYTQNILSFHLNSFLPRKDVFSKINSTFLAHIHPHICLCRSFISRILNILKHRTNIRGNNNNY